jgi:formylglycine-generating enzyme required for sulfatase activity
MASIITLAGIDNAILSLNYSNKNTFKYKYVHHIGQYYTNENSVESVGEIDNEELIKILWDTAGSPEEIKKKRKNLNSLRSSVNTDLKKLYMSGKNPEGVKIGPGNIFVMLDDAKDKILNEYGYDLKPDGKLKLDQMIDILRLANETVSGSVAVEEKGGKDGLIKIAQLKSLIKGLSEKVGSSFPELSETNHKTEGGIDGFKKFEKVDDLREVSDDIVGEGEGEGILEELEEVNELEENEVLEEVEDLEEVSDEIAEQEKIEENPEEIEELEEDEVLEEVEDVDPDELIEVTEDSEAVGDQDDLEGVGINRGLDTSGSGDGPDGVGVLEKDAGMGFQSGDTGDGHSVVNEGVGSGGGIGPDCLGTDETSEDMETDDPQEIEEIEEIEEDEISEEVEDLEEVEDVDPDELIEVTEDSEAVAGQEELEGAGSDRGLGESDENFDEDNGKDGIKKAEGAKETEAIGLPVDSLGKEYSDEVSDKVKKDRLLAEEFDGYLGVMDRYYNHYILIPGGEYIVGSQKPGKDEKPEQLISLSPFYIGRFPVTNGLFEIFVEKTGYKTVAEKVGYGNVYYGRCQRKKDEKTGLITSVWNSSLYFKIVEGACWYQPFGTGSTLHNKKNHPVVQISLEDAMAFAAWTGKRLPTEDEWEAAARTEKGWSFPWGKEWKKHCCNIEDSLVGDTTPVEKYAEFENELGIVDTMGNIIEWTSDNFTALSDNKIRSGCHIAKGGSWISQNDIRLFSRFKIAPESHSNILGFRCVAH